VEKIGFIIHEDGTLTDEDAALLRERLPVISILSRREADDLVLPQLQKHRACLEYRRSSPLALKLFDVALLDPSPLYFCDSDVLFLTPHTGLFQGILAGGLQAVFMRDNREAYALRPWDVPPLGRQRVVSRLNSGLFALAAGAFDLDFIDSFLGKNRDSRAFRRRPGWVEQTCWAAMAARLPTRLYDSRHMRVAHPGLLQAKDRPIAIHFVSTYRGMIDHYHEVDSPAEPSKPQAVRLREASPATACTLAASEAAAQWRRLRGC
jgi:hypothetical protein